MSLESWKEEFYPVSANNLVANLKSFMSENEINTKLMYYSLLKWRNGTTKEALRKHDVIYENGIIKDKENKILSFASDSCAFCKKYCGCSGCPIFNFLGHSCDTLSSKYGLNFYVEAKSNPKFMVNLLTKVKKVLDRL
jgi:hypothetical protein